MKKMWMVSALMLTVSSFPVWSADKKAADNNYSYALGYTLGKNIVQKFPGVDSNQFLQAMSDAVKNKKSKLTDEQIAQAFQAHEEKKKNDLNTAAEKNAQRGKQFIENYKKQKGVQALSDGMYYKVLKSGKGTTPRADSTVEVHYEGTLIDGSVFDSSYKRGQPISFPLNRVIKGWTIAVQKMQPGDKWEVVIPAELAYGLNGAPGGRIGPNETLIFKIELLKVL